MEKEPLVSVVMPAYRSAGLIGETIDALLAQTYSNWELECIDDGSPDTTAEVVARYTDPRIHLTRLGKNRGIAGATNEGFSRARGKYVVMMDNDDVSFPDRIACEVNWLEAHPEIDGCGSGHIVLSRSLAWDKLRAWWKKRRSVLETADETACATLFSGDVFNPTMCFRREVLEHLSVWFDPALKAGIDTDFYSRMIAAGARLVVLPDVLLRYRRLAGSYSHRFKQAGWDSRGDVAMAAVRRLVPQPAPEQERLHRMIVQRDSSLLPGDLPQVQSWFTLLVESNRERQIFVEKALLKKLAHHWGRACAIAGCHSLSAGWKTWGNFALLRPYLGSPLAFLYEWQKRALGRKRTRPLQ